MPVAPTESFPSYLHPKTPWGESPEGSVLRTSMDGGLAKQLKLSTRALVRRDVAYGGTHAQFLLFRTWFESNIRRGQDWFNWTDPVDQVVKPARIVAANPAYTATANRLVLGSWTIRFQIETWG